MKERPDVSIIVVSYEKVDLLEQTLLSICNVITQPTIEIIVVDNASSEMNVQMVQTKFPNVKLIRNNRNLGFGSGCNIGAASSRAEVLLFVNSDIKLQTNPLPGMLKLLKDVKDAGVVGCQLLNPEGSLQPSYFRFPGFLLRFLQLTGVKHLLVRLIPQLRFHRGDEFEVDMVPGAFFAIRRDLFNEIGGFDERFFMYIEDADLCFRIRKAGKKVLVRNTNPVVHFGFHRENLDNPFLMHHYNRGLLLFYQKHYTRSKRVGIIVMSIVAFWVRYLVGSLFSHAQLRQGNIRRTLEMYVDALRNSEGQ